jgi:sulfhydrogenase subunit delta
MNHHRPKVAFFDFAGCEGCQLTVIDSLQTHPDLLEAVEIVQFREAISERGEDYALAFVEGSCARPRDEDRLRAIREQAALVIALGACACIGGVNAGRNRQPEEDVRRYVYGDRAEAYDSYPARPIDRVIQVDGYIPGCPVDRDEFIRSVKMLLQGRIPELPEYPVCVECKLRETACLFLRGQACLGPVTRAGCAAICPSVGMGCEGCRGLIPAPNLHSLYDVLHEHGLSDTLIEAKFSLFLSQALIDQPDAAV